VSGHTGDGFGVDPESLCGIEAGGGIELFHAGQAGHTLPQAGTDNGAHRATDQGSGTTPQKGGDGPE
jgi:hypothetical protein